MIDFSRFPAPDNAPEPGSCIRIERPEKGLMVLVLDPPHRKLAVLDQPLLRDLDKALDYAEQESGLQGLVITGRDAFQFAAGADIDAIEGIDDTAIAEQVVIAVHHLYRRIEKFPFCTVAAVGGPVPGGAYEMSLACDCIVATDHAKTRIGLPETQLGILPGWGGCHRLPRRVGVAAALTPILTGKLYPAKKARRMGMIDRVTKPEYLLRVASNIALGREKNPRRWRPGWKQWLVDKNPLATWFIGGQARKATLAKTHGHYPAPLAALDLVIEAPRTPMEAAATKEARAIAALATGSVCKNLISIFRGSEEAKRLGRGKDGARPRTIEHGAVIGAGVMGGAIASVMAARGIHTRLTDLSQAALDAAVIDHRKDVAKQLRRRRFQRHEADAALDRMDTSTELVGLSRSQFVIEAVAERLDVKHKVFGEVARQVADDCVLATNTSSLSVAALAASLPHPERVCGMHFFNPVRRMPLVEIVRGPQTRDEVITEVAALALRLGKTPVVVKDVAGFLVNRILGPYLDEAIRVFAGGADIQRVDRALRDFGMPMGPFALLDEVGFDIAMHASQSLHEAYGERMIPSDGMTDMVGPERLGKKTGLGFYRYPKGKRGKRTKPEPADDLVRFQTATFAQSLANEQLVDRLILPMVNEAARCLEERVVETPSQLDLATIFGTGFAPFRGGPLRFADSLGAAEIVRRLNAIAAAPEVADRPGGTAKFTPARLLRSSPGKAAASTSARKPHSRKHRRSRSSSRRRPWDRVVSPRLHQDGWAGHASCSCSCLWSGAAAAVKRTPSIPTSC